MFRKNSIPSSSSMSSSRDKAHNPSRLTSDSDINQSRLPVLKRSGTYIIEPEQSLANQPISIDSPVPPPAPAQHSQRSRIAAPVKHVSSVRNTRAARAETVEFANQDAPPEQGIKDLNISNRSLNGSNNRTSNLSMIKQQKRAEISRLNARSKTTDDSNIHPSGLSIENMLNNSRRSGQLSLVDMNLFEVPMEVWLLNTERPNQTNRSSHSHSMDNEGDFKWWDQVDLLKLYIVSNKIKNIPRDIRNLSTLLLLDIHDNLIESIDEGIGELKQLQTFNASHNQLQQLPNNLCNLRDIISFNVSYNKLNQLPKNFGQLDNIEDLNLSNNCLNILPKSFGWMNRLRKLNLSTNKITRLIPDVFYSTNLKIIDLSENQIEDVPPEIGELYNLEQLFLRQNKKYKHYRSYQNVDWDISFNKLKQIDENSFDNLVSLTNFNLRDNQLETLPKTIKIIQTLERLDISNNNLSNLPFELAGIPSLKQILITGNPLRAIRKDIINRGTDAIMKYLRNHYEEPAPANSNDDQDVVLKTDVIKSSKVLDLSFRKLTSLNTSMVTFCKQSTALVLNLSKNQLNDLPEELNMLQNQLNELNLSFNYFQSLPESVFTLSNLTFLDVRGNQLTTISYSICRLTALKELVIADNRLAEIPAGVYELPILENLFANNNQIQTVDPFKIIKMRYLSTLNLQNNNIMQVPLELGKATQLRSLLLEGNPFRLPPPQKLAKGTAAVLEYLRGRLSE